MIFVLNQFWWWILFFVYLLFIIIFFVFSLPFALISVLKTFWKIKIKKTGDFERTLQITYSEELKNVFLILLSKELRLIASTIERVIKISPVNWFFPMEFNKEAHTLDEENSMSQFTIFLSKVAYEHKEKARDYLENCFGEKNAVEKFHNLHYSNEKDIDTDGFIVKFKNYKKVFIVFRGTEPFSKVDWLTDFNFKLIKVEDENLKEKKKKKYYVHEGFYRAINDGKESILSQIEKILLKEKELKDSEIVVTGHSLGGALASVFPIVSKLKKKLFFEKIDKVYTFAAPRIGNSDFCNAINNTKIEIRRIVLDMDLVPRVPCWIDHLASKNESTKKVISKFFLPFQCKKFAELIRSKIPNNVFTLFLFNIMDHSPGFYERSCYYTANNVESSIQRTKNAIKKLLNSISLFIICFCCCCCCMIKKKKFE